MMRFARVATGLLLAWAAAASPPPGGWLQLHSQNPHYFLYGNKALVLVTSGEHYGVVINRAFDYRRYLKELQSKHLNLTRLWVGPYREVEGSFAIANNTLAPNPGDFIAPWPRSTTPGALDGGNKFDLSAWNSPFFERLKDFVREAAARGVIVEVNLFCPYYRDEMWKASPFNADNNVNGIGSVARTDVLALKEAGLTEAQDRLVRKLAAELREFGNLFFEICNEPYFGGVTAEWQRHIARTLHDAETDGRRHLISMNIANGSIRVEAPDPLVSIFNFHYSRPPRSVELNYDLARPIGMNETGFDGNSDAVYRIQGWDFLMAGGALYNNLDYSFTVGHEDGSFQYTPATPGGGSARLRTQLGFLRDWFESLDLVRMKPDARLLSRVSIKNASARALSDGQGRYAVYVHQGRVESQPKAHFVVDSAPQSQSLELVLPPGKYQVSWLDPKSRTTLKRFTLAVANETASVQSPVYIEDLLLDIRRNASK
jgi:hypothetical protein